MIEKLPDKRGKIIVFEGSDGVGKTTQTGLFLKRLEKLNKKVETIKFPQYEENYFGGYIRECLDGKYGDFANEDPSFTSILYAFDRHESRDKLNGWLKDDRVIVADRYTSANQIHQGGKIKDSKKRDIFLNWLDKMEFEILSLPKPNLVIYLHVPFEISMKLLRNRGKKLDVVENNPNYLKNSIDSAEGLSKKNKNWHRIDCAPNGDLLPINIIHEKVWKRAQSLFS